MSKTIKRYRLAKKGDEGRECWVTNSSEDYAFQYAKSGSLPPVRIDGFYRDKVVDNNFVTWTCAVIADEAPNPGDGYRFLKKKEYDGEDELVQDGDDFFDDIECKWKKSNNTQQDYFHYRRKVETDSSLVNKEIDFLTWKPKVGDLVKVRIPKSPSSKYLEVINGKIYPVSEIDTEQEMCAVSSLWIFWKLTRRELLSEVTE